MADHNNHPLETSATSSTTAGGSSSRSPRWLLVARKRISPDPTADTAFVWGEAVRQLSAWFLLVQFLLFLLVGGWPAAIHLARFLTQSLGFNSDLDQYDLWAEIKGTLPLLPTLALLAAFFLIANKRTRLGKGFALFGLCSPLIWFGAWLIDQAKFNQLSLWPPSDWGFTFRPLVVFYIALVLLHLVALFVGFAPNAPALNFSGWLSGTWMLLLVYLIGIATAFVLDAMVPGFQRFQEALLTLTGLIIIMLSMLSLVYLLTMLRKRKPRAMWSLVLTLLWAGATLFGLCETAELYGLALENSNVEREHGWQRQDNLVPCAVQTICAAIITLICFFHSRRRLREMQDGSVLTANYQPRNLKLTPSNEPILTYPGPPEQTLLAVEKRLGAAT